MAVVQARMVEQRLRLAEPGATFALKTIKTQGDKDRTRSLDEIGGQGVFVKELEHALLAHDIDLAVHSLKDMPSELEHSLILAAVLPRDDVRDALVTRSGQPLARLPAGTRIGTDSRRRGAQLKALRPDIITCSIRGNIDTRLRKVQEGEVDGIIIAAAALSRMGWEDRVVEYLPLESFLPAVGQGAIAIEIRERDVAVSRLVASVNHAPSWHSILAERSFLRTLGGGCRAPIAALATVRDGQLVVDGMVASADYSVVLRDGVSGPPERAEKIGEALARRILGKGGDRIVVEAGRSDTGAR